METFVLDKGSRATNPFKRQIGHLIASTGTPNFEASFFQVAREAMACEHLTAFASSDRSPARLLLAINRGARPIARMVAEKYLKHYWNHDPANLVCGQSASPHYEMGVHLSCRDIDHEDYRHDCYSSVDMVDRFSIIRRQRDETVRLNLYRNVRRGPFAATDFALVLDSADVLLALLAKHDKQRPPSDQASETEIFVSRLRQIAPGLTRRELDVCIGIMEGRSSEAIALALSVSVNTVLTYRKRAYTRLRISSQNELMRLVLM